MPPNFSKKPKKNSRSIFSRPSIVSMSIGNCHNANKNDSLEITNQLKIYIRFLFGPCFLRCCFLKSDTKNYKIFELIENSSFDRVSVEISKIVQLNLGKHIYIYIYVNKSVEKFCWFQQEPFQNLKFKIWKFKIFVISSVLFRKTTC